MATRLIQYIPDRVAHAARIRLPERRLVTLEHVGHWPAIEASEVVVAEVRAAARFR